MLDDEPFQLRNDPPAPKPMQQNTLWAEHDDQRDLQRASLEGQRTIFDEQTQEQH
jgi:hypothetical protein